MNLKGTPRIDRLSLRQVIRRSPIVTHINAGLCSVEGARHIINEISSRPSVTQLVLGQNKLGDDGCVELFEYLSSEDGKKYNITSISLNSNEVGDKGLKAITQYLHANESLKELLLQNNMFQGEGNVVAPFTSAVNSSRLKNLVLSTHASLSDAFVFIFFPKLDSPHLCELHLSMLGLTRRSLPYITSYLASRRSRSLVVLKLNGNQLGYRSVRTIIQTIERHNFSLLKLELYGNMSLDRQTSDFSDDEGSVREALQLDLADLNRIELRNRHLKNLTQQQAFKLLQCARPVLFRSSKATLSANVSLIHSEPSILDGSRDTPSRGKCDTPSQYQHNAFPTLPTEIEFHILSFIAPCLSTAQQLRVFDYCSDPSTLPPLLPRLGSAFEGNLEGVSVRRDHYEARANHRDKDSISWWLEVVGCNYYEEG